MIRWLVSKSGTIGGRNYMNVGTRMKKNTEKNEAGIKTVLSNRKPTGSTVRKSRWTTRRALKNAVCDGRKESGRHPKTNCTLLCQLKRNVAVTTSVRLESKRKTKKTTVKKAPTKPAVFAYPWVVRTWLLCQLAPISATFPVHAIVI